MNKRVCASILGLRRPAPCTRTDRLSRSCSSSQPPPHAPPCTSMHTNITYRWMSLCVVLQYDLKRLQIKFSVKASVPVLASVFSETQNQDGSSERRFFYCNRN